MGTMAAFYSRSPLAGGTLIGTIGMDGHPDRMRSIARAKTYTAYRAAVRRIKARDPYWWTPQRIWWSWPSAGLIVHDFSYWWDDERQSAVVARYQFGPVALDEEVARDFERWPRYSVAALNPALIGVPLPEFFATVDPWDLPDGPLHTRNTAGHPDEGEAAERLFSGSGAGEIVLARLAGAQGTWSQAQDPALFHASADGIAVNERSVIGAAKALSGRVDGLLGPAITTDRNAPYLYSVEDFLQECRFGPVRIAHRNDRFIVDAVHPLAGSIHTEDDTLAKALVLARRHLLATPGFHLHCVAPFGMKHVGNDPCPRDPDTE